MWQRSTGLTLTGLGSGAVAAALTLAAVAPGLSTIPLAETVQGTSRGTGLTVFNAAELTQRSDVDVVARKVVTGNPTAPEAGPGTAVWTSGTVLTDTAGALIGTDEITFCMDRRTGAATGACPSARHNGDAGVKLTGQIVRFPLGTGHQDYQLFDPPTGRAWPVLFDDSDYVDGLEVDRFVQEVPSTVIGRQEVPGDVAGGKAGTTVQADVVYSATRTVWVEPRSGIVVRTVEEPLQFLRAPDGKPVAVLLFGSIGSDDPTVAGDVARAERSRTTILLLEVYGPLGLGLAGLVSLLLGLLVVRRHQRMPPAPSGPDASGPDAGEPDAGEPDASGPGVFGPAPPDPPALPGPAPSTASIALRPAGPTQPVRSR